MASKKGKAISSNSSKIVQSNQTRSLKPVQISFAKAPLIYGNPNQANANTKTQKIRKYPSVQDLNKRFGWFCFVGLKDTFKPLGSYVSSLL